VATHIIQKVNNVLEYVEACEELNHLFKFSSKDNASLLNNIFDCRNNNINFGKKLVFFKQLNLEELRSYLHDSDSFLGNLAIARLQLSYNMCFTDYIEIKNTYIEARDMYHLSIENYVPNDIILNEQNVIITGPNAAGKSTFIKGLILNVILSQTYGIACASSFKLTPFYFINTQINIPDVKGKQSLFEAEMFRCKSNLDIITQLPDDKKALIVMDEVFSSTNVVEGVAGAYGILEKMSTYPNVCTIVTTHFLYLTKLKSFKKYKMNVEFEDEDTIKYPYRLDTGISKQLVAIELIKNNFDDDVINTALTIKNKLLV
jgi:DNA mismatch repair ATPase MutS